MQAGFDLAIDEFGLILQCASCTTTLLRLPAYCTKWDNQMIKHILHTHNCRGVDRQPVLYITTRNQDAQALDCVINVNVSENVPPPSVCAIQ